MLKKNQNSRLTSWLADSVRVFVAVFLLALAIFVVWLLAASNWGTSLPETNQSSLLIARGEQVFKENGCFYSCHVVGSLSNKGKQPAQRNQVVVPPDLTTTLQRTDDWLLAYLIYPQLLLPASPMRSYNYLGTENMEALIAYLQSIKTKAPMTNSQPPEQAETLMAPLNFETYQKGRSIFEMYCKGCHGYAGNGKGVAGHLLLPEPRDFTDAVWMSKQTARYLFSIISKGKSNTAMPGYRDIFSPGEIALLLNYVKLFSDPIMRQRLELPLRDNDR